MHRKSYVMSKPGYIRNPGTNLKDSSVFCSGDIRCRVGVTFTQGFMWNAGTSNFNVKGEVQVEDLYKSQSTDVKNWGGMTRSSDEAFVMRVERRGRVVWYCLKNQLLFVGGVH